MIFVTLGTQQIPFPRILREIDDLIERGVIDEKVIAQKGYTDYTPRHFECVDLLSEEEFRRHISLARVVITHAGSGAIFNIIKSGVKGIAVARLHKYGEMMDDHQTELVHKLCSDGYILDGSESIEAALRQVDEFTPRACDFTQHITEAVKEYIASLTF